jgi:hypothetical protein
MLKKDVTKRSVFTVFGKSKTNIISYSFRDEESDGAS